MSTLQSISPSLLSDAPAEPGASREREAEAHPSLHHAHAVAELTPVRPVQLAGAAPDSSAIVAGAAHESPFESPFRSVLDMLPAAAYTCAPGGHITYFNRHALALWGRTPRLNDDSDRYCGSHRLYAVDGTPMRHADCWMALALRNAEEYDGREIMVERPDGTRRVVLAHASPTYDANGMLSGGVNVLVDITGQKNAEAKQLEANRRKDLFLATLAHELRNPLAPIRCAVPLLRRAVGGPDAAPVLAMLERQVDHLVRLVNDLLEASRITRGKLTLRKERVEIGSIIGSAVETSRPCIEAGQHTLRVHALAGEAWLDADPVRLGQVLSNLLDNAAKFTPLHGTIDVDAVRDDGKLVISVRDTGPGIRPELLPHVFDLFMQEERWIDGMKAGLGVGLALVKSLVELHGGTVSASSAGEGKGSQFTVCLPLQAVPPRPAAAAVGSERDKGAAAQRVLIVDDNRDAAQSLAMLVELLGNTASVSFDGPAALAAARSFAPTIALLDLSMPGMNGFEVARRLRAAPGGQHLRLVALSGRSEDEYRRQSEAAGFDAHIAKPVDLATLQAVLAAPGNASPGTH